MSEGIGRRSGLALCLAAALALTSLGCRPSSTSTQPPTTNKTPDQKSKPDNKPNKSPKHEPG
jgi:hypothetical protein